MNTFILVLMLSTIQVPYNTIEFASLDACRKAGQIITMKSIPSSAASVSTAICISKETGNHEMIAWPTPR